jgi:hypothetical protein
LPTTKAPRVSGFGVSALAPAAGHGEDVEVRHPAILVLDAELAVFLLRSFTLSATGSVIVKAIR